MQPDRDLIILSDLHIGRGRNPETGRYHTLEAFFYDDDFARFCHYLCEDARRRGSAFRLILNGDVLDLLRIDGDGEPHTPEAAATLVAHILAGHPVVVSALAEVLAEGHDVVILPGNHDLETQWQPVRDELCRAITAALREHGLADPSAALERLRLLDWFYHEPGRIWVEHGCQYDPENAFRYLLRGGAVNVAERILEAEHDMPLGNFFQRYLYNGFGHITFIVPTARANLRYIKWLLVNQPRLLFRVLVSHLPFGFQVIRRLASSAVPGERELARLHEGRLRELAQSSGLGERLVAIDDLKEVRADVVQAVRTLGWQLLKVTSAAALVALFTISLWYVGFMSINELRAGFGMKAFLFFALNAILLLLAAGTLSYSLLRGAPVSSKPFTRAAQHIATLLDVPIVTFGHTHDETVVRLARHDGGRAWYFNTGTWIAIFTHDVLMPRERVQYTFLRVRGHDAELLHWSPGRKEPLSVILLDEPDEHDSEPLAAPAPPPALADPARQKAS
jgi:UDP-2,3-diacylglucosamine pyrophosphatase LpxH